MDTAKIIETLKAMEDSKWYLYEMYERDGEPEKAQESYGEYIAIWTVRRMLEKPEYAATMREIYFKEESKDVEMS